MRGREIHLAAHPVGRPTSSEFRLVEVRVPSPAAGELLVRNTWMSIDPSTRIRMSGVASDYLPPFELGAPLAGWAVG